MPFSEALDLVYPNFHLNEDVRKVFTSTVAKEYASKKRRSGKPATQKAFAAAAPAATASKSTLIQTPTFKQAVETLCKALSVGRFARKSQGTSSIRASWVLQLTSSSSRPFSGDVCIIGSRGCGKNTLAHFAASQLGHDDASIVHVPLYKDMSARELLQSRHLDDGTTVWR